MPITTFAIYRIAPGTSRTPAVFSISSLSIDKIDYN
jgi:hypothetical protein